MISPGGVGYDINCGVRLLVSLATVEEIKPFLEDVASSLYANCPSGVGSRGHLRLTNTELDRVLHGGSRRWPTGTYRVWLKSSTRWGSVGKLRDWSLLS